MSAAPRTRTSLRSASTSCSASAAGRSRTRKGPSTSGSRGWIRTCRRLPTGFYIETRYCYHYTYGEDATLKWDGPPYSYSNKIIWDDDSDCQVKAVWRK